MIARTLAIMRKEFWHIIRDRNTLFLILAIPIVQMIMLGYAATTNIKNISVAVWDQDQTAASRRLINTLNDTDYFNVTRYVLGEEQMRDLLDAGEVRAVVVIPEDFGASIVGGNPHEVELVLDGSDPLIANTILAAAFDVVQEQVQQVRAALGDLPLRLGVFQIRPTILYNPDLKSANYMIPALMGLILQFFAMLLTALTIVRERERGTLEQLIATPIRPAELILGKTVPYVFVAFFNLLEVLLVGVFWFGVPIQGSVGLLLVLAALFLVGSLGMGILISTVATTQWEAVLLTFFFLMPCIFLSGFFFPLEAMPWALRALGYLVPLRYMLIIIRGIVLKGVGLSVLKTEVTILAIFGAVVLTLAARRFRKSLD